MKKLLLLFVLISGFAFGQFEITDSSDNWRKVGNAQAHTILYQKNDNTKAKIEYRDAQPLNLFNPNNIDLTYYTFEFSTEPDTLEKLSQIIKTHFQTKKEEIVTLQFPEGKMMLEFVNSFGTYYSVFKFEKANTLLDKGDKSIKSTMGMKEKHIDSLFGISKK